MKGGEEKEGVGKESLQTEMQAWHLWKERTGRNTRQEEFQAEAQF